MANDETHATVVGRATVRMLKNVHVSFVPFHSLLFNLYTPRQAAPSKLHLLNLYGVNTPEGRWGAYL